MTKREEALYFLREWRTIPKQLTLEEFNDHYARNKGIIRVKYMPVKKGSNLKNTMDFALHSFSKAFLARRVKSVKFIKNEIPKKKQYFKIYED